MSLNIGDRIKELRRDKPLSRRELAANLGLEYSTLAKYENNERKPDYDVLTNLANYFGCYTDYLLGESPFRSPAEAEFSIKVAVMKRLLNDEEFKLLGYDDLIWNSAIDITELLYDDNAINFVKSLRTKRTLTDDEYYKLSKYVTTSINWPNKFDGPTTLIIQGEKITCDIDYWNIPKIPFIAGSFSTNSSFEFTRKDRDLQSLIFKREFLYHIPLIRRIPAVATDGQNNITVIPGEYIIIDTRVHDISKYSFRELYALKVIGQSMEPTIHDGEIVLVKIQEMVQPGQIGVFAHNGEELIIKRFAQEGDNVYLLPDNKQFPAQEYKSGWQCMGLVLESIRRVIK